MLNAKARMVFIPYVGLLGDANKWSVSKQATSSFFKRINSILPNWKFIIVELEDPASVGTGTPEFRKRMARIKLFTQHCADAGLRLNLVPFQYLHPPYHTDSTDSDIDAMRLCVITRRDYSSVLSASDALEIIEFIYSGIYINCVWRDAPESSRYVKDTLEMLEQYKKAIKTDVRLRRHYSADYEWSIL